MCGIAGLYAFPASRPTQSGEVSGELSGMIAALHHRGPDGRNSFIDGPVGLAHARLAIIDVAGGAQPLANEDESVWVVLNGEIFNFVELRRELEQRSHRFKTRSDTEVIVHLYEDFGDNFVDHLNGQFALALWDKKQQRLVLARDRSGIRPLFYTQQGGRLAFASEVKALFTLPEVPRRIDVNGLAAIFSVWAVLPPHTVFEGIHSLPPAHLMVVTPQGIQTKRYWDWQFDEATVTRHSEADCAEELRALMIDAVRLQLRSDVPVGAYLSGGLDSAVITSIIKNLSPNHKLGELNSHSLTFEDAEFDESAQQREVARHLGTAHHSLPCHRSDIAAGFSRAVWHAESPLVRTAPVPLMLLADRVRAAGQRVVLTGEGADEVFAGYDIFKEARLRRFMAREPNSKWRGRLLERLYPYLKHSPGAAGALASRFFSRSSGAVDAADFAHQPRINTSRRALQFLNPDLLNRAGRWNPSTALQAATPPGFSHWPALMRDQYMEAHTLMSGYLLSSQGDRMAMAASVEARFPFLDHRVIEFANRLPPHYKLCGLREKRILKAAFAADLPASITGRSKQPFRAPDSSSFFVDEKTLPWVADLLSASSLHSAGLFDPVAVEKLVEKCRSGRAVGFGDNIAFVGVLSTMLLHQQFVAPPVFHPPSS
jgi:asparagine synthase (glutamine-hydrolysing)